jgi:vitamin B12 transporter
MIHHGIRVSIAAFILMSALSPNCLYAQGDDPAAIGEPAALIQETMVVTANRAEAPRKTVGSSVTVISAEEIALRKKSSVAELLRTVPGLEVVRGGGPGQITSVFLRGGNSSHTLVLVDGVRLNSSTGGAYDFANLSTDGIERIEIVRGPQSTLYGSEAMAGVIQIFTKKGTDGFHVSGLAEVGDASHRRFRLGLEGGGERFDVALTVSDEKTDGVSAASERAGNRELDPFENFAATLRAGYDLAEGGRVDLVLRAFDGETKNDGFDFFVGPVDDLDFRQSREGLAGRLKVSKQLSDRFKQSFRVGLADEELTGIDPTNFFSNFTIESKTLELASQSEFTLSERDVLTVGFAWEEREGGSVGSFEESLEIASVFVQNAWNWENRVFFTAGLRYDDHSEFGDETTYRLSSSWQVAAASRLHGSFGTGFKAPTLNDLFFPFFSNPALRPETSQGFDLGFEQSWFDERLRIDVTWFDMEFEDLIVFDFATFLPQNLAEATSTGVEFTVDYKVGPKFQIAASHTYNDTEDLASGQQLARRPRERSTLNLFFQPVERLTGNVSFIVGRDRIESDGTKMDDYERLDLTLEYRLSESFKPYLRVENLFDDDYEEVNGFTTPGIVAVVGLGFRY